MMNEPEMSVVELDLDVFIQKLFENPPFGRNEMMIEAIDYQHLN